MTIKKLPSVECPNRLTVNTPMWKFRCTLSGFPDVPNFLGTKNDTYESFKVFEFFEKFLEI